VVKDNEEFDRTVAPMRDRLASMYVEKQSVGLDIYCIFRTVQLIFQIMILKKREFPYTKHEQEAAEAVFGTAVNG
jgi:lipopolysaccharide/colanic/teichoic acid biosynthesis glycosyltransferase